MKRLLIFVLAIFPGTLILHESIHVFQLWTLGIGVEKFTLFYVTPKPYPINFTPPLFIMEIIAELASVTYIFSSYFMFRRSVCTAS